MARKKRFEGFDFTELLKAWDLPMSEEGVDDIADLKTLKNHMNESFDYGTMTLNPEVKKDMLRYLDAMVKTGFSGYIPVYRAMKKLDDFEFMEVYRAMLHHMWT
jgi:hypothetical protein